MHCMVYTEMLLKNEARSILNDDWKLLMWQPQGTQKILCIHIEAEMSLSPFFVSWGFSSKAILGGYNVGGRKRGGGEKTPEKAVLSKSFLFLRKHLAACGLLLYFVFCVWWPNNVFLKKGQDYVWWPE